MLPSSVGKFSQAEPKTEPLNTEVDPSRRQTVTRETRAHEPACCNRVTCEPARHIIAIPKAGAASPISPTRHRWLPVVDEADQQDHRQRRESKGGRRPKFDAKKYRGRNVVERGYSRLKQWRRLAKRYDKLAII